MGGIARWVAALTYRLHFRLLGAPTTPVFGRSRGLRKLSPHEIAEARSRTADRTGRIAVTFIVWCGFCALALLTPDSALLRTRPELNVPFVGPVSFFGFLLLGPAVLIALRIYLQLYVEHGERLARLACRMRDARVPTLLPLKNRLVRWWAALGFYLLVPMMLWWFAWKAAVFPLWGAALLCVAAAAGASHIMLAFRRLSWRSVSLVSVCAVVVAAGTMFRAGPPRRPYNLFGANLAGDWLPLNYLPGVNLGLANLRSGLITNSRLLRRGRVRRGSFGRGGRIGLRFAENP